MAAELPPLPKTATFDETRAKQKEIEVQQAALLNEIKALQAKAKLAQPAQSQARAALAELRQKQGEVSQKIKALDEQIHEKEAIFKDPRIKEIKDKIRPIPLNPEKIKAKIAELDDKFQHTALSTQEENNVRAEIAKLKKYEIEIEKIDFSLVEKARAEFEQLQEQKKPLLKERIALRDQYDQESQKAQEEKTANQEVKSEADVIWAQIKEKRGEFDNLKKQHQEIFDNFKKEQHEYNRIRALHDEARKLNQEKRKVLEPIAKKLQEYHVRYQEAPLYSCKYDIQTPDYSSMLQSADDEFNRAQLVQWIDSQLAQHIDTTVTVQNAARQGKENDLSQFAKKDKKDKKDKKQKERNLVDYSGFELFGACGLKFSDYEGPEKLRALREQLSSGNEDLKQKKLDEVKAKVEAILAELSSSGGEWQWVEKVELIKREFGEKRSFDRQPNGRRERASNE